MIKRLVTNYGLGIGLGLVGFFLGGELGGIIGFGMGVLLVLSWRMNRREAYLEARRAYLEVPEPTELSATKMLGFGIAVFTIAFPCYATIIVLIRNGIFAEWISVAKPAADFLAQYIPALAIPGDIEPGNNFESAIVIQHVLFAGWAVSIPMAIWIVLDIFLIHGRAWNRAVVFPGRLKVIKQILLPSLILFAVMMPFLFVGWWEYQPAFRFSFEKLGLAQAPLLAIIFVAAIITFRGVALALNALVRRSFFDDPGARNEPWDVAKRKMLDAVRQSTPDKFTNVESSVSRTPMQQTSKH
jgi:hypothetical protein